MLTNHERCGINYNIGAVSSAGRAPALQAGCHQFDPGTAQCHPIVDGFFIFKHIEFTMRLEHIGLEVLDIYSVSLFYQKLIIFWEK